MVCLLLLNMPPFLVLVLWLPLPAATEQVTNRIKSTRRFLTVLLALWLGAVDQAQPHPCVPLQIGNLIQRNGFVLFQRRGEIKARVRCGRE